MMKIMLFYLVKQSMSKHLLELWEDIFSTRLVPVSSDRKRP